MIQRLLSILVASALIICIFIPSAYAHSETEVPYSVEGGNIYFDKATGTITKCDESVTSAIIPEEITGVPVVDIASHAFKNHKNLAHITIGNNVSTIASEAFMSCSNLRSITISSSITKIGAGAFGWCEKLDEVYISNLLAWCNIVFDSPSSNPLFQADYLYINGSLPTNIVVPDGVKSISYYAFSCNNLVSITLPNSVTNINASAFEDCTNLSNITIPNSVVSIGAHAFRDCDSLISLDIPHSVTTLGESLFYSCDNLVSVSLPNNITSIGSYTFSFCKKLTSISIPDSVRNIGDNAFRDCDSLGSITLPRNIDTIADETFRGCHSLAYIAIPSSVKYIDYGAFRNCGLNHVFYSGTASQWDNINIATENAPLYVNTVLHAESSGTEVSTRETCIGNITSCNICNLDILTIKHESLRHNYTEVRREPTCIEYGYVTIICSICGDVNYSYDFPPTGHYYIDDYLPPSCVSDGYISRFCYTCRAIDYAYAIPSVGHAFSNGICVVCNIEDPDYVISNPFVDVKEGDYFYDPVLWAVKEGITTGTSATTFGPEKPCTRGQVVTFLWRACGSPEPTNTDNPFSDVKESAYYYKAVLWAVEQGITTGISKTAFGPDKTCTRGQVATFLWRAQGKPIPTTTINPFTDIEEDFYYYSAVLWAVEEGITNGTGKGLFSPDKDCTRGQIVTFLYRALS